MADTRRDLNPDLNVPFMQPPPGSGPDSVKVLAYFLLYSMAMFSLPFLAFFGTRHTLKNTFHIEGFANTAWSVVSVVIVINVIILMYACKGFVEAEEEDNKGDTQTSTQKSDLNLKKDN